MPSLPSRTPTYVGRLCATALLAATALLGTTTDAFAKPTEDQDTRTFSGFMLRSLCQEGVSSGSAGFSCTMPDGSVWTCVAHGPHGLDQYMCVREGATDPGPSSGQLPEFPGPTEATRVPPTPPPAGGPIATLPNQPPVQTR